jgi:hypothetical protein
MTYNLTLRRVRATNVALEKPRALHIVNFFLELGNQHAMRMCFIVVCGLTGTTLFSRLSHKRREFSREVLKIKHVSNFLHKNCLKYLSFEEELRAMVSYTHIGLRVKYTLFVSDFNGT